MSRRLGRILASFGFALLPLTLVAQRAPVLQQVKVPHPYYYREMFIPQVTSGPSSATWSPDGRELVYAMEGSLWRQRTGSDEAHQLTDGPGYAYQPDWSPDGRRVVYASYHDDAIELRLLDLASGESRVLLNNGAVNLEPRWSPDGTRIAFTSSAYEGRWHGFVIRPNDNGQPAEVTRVTEDRESGLPRYYYHQVDQYLSPTWSPDSRELILISNRGHIWGSGGFWRLRLEEKTEPREIHYEETTWKAKPDWSRDGHRVVYSSYLGRQWHQLWLMTADGGDAFQLTYGEFDATAPRWSPNGDRIAYVSNQGGSPALWLIYVTGGKREKVAARRRMYLAPTGRIRLLVTDSKTGKPLAARASITGPDGRSYAPDGAWRYADDAYDRSERKLEYGYFHLDGSATLTVPAGQLRIEVSRGPEYRVVTQTIKVPAGLTSTVRVKLARLLDLPARGWYSGDLHVHMNYGGAYRNDPTHLAFQARAEDLHLVENLIVNKEGRVPDVDYFRAGPDPASSPGTLIVHGQEYHTSFWGHVGLLGLRDHLVMPGYTAYANTAVASLQPTNAVIFDLAREQGGVTGYVHPFDAFPDPGDTTRPLTHEIPVDVALGKVDYYEALGFVDDPMATARVWYRLLNCGFRLPAGAGTDAMANFASLRGPVGMNRVFVRSGAPLEHRRWLTALKQGRSFATNGPLLDFTLSGQGPGDEIRLPERGGELLARVAMRSNVPMDHLEIVANGEVLRTIPLDQDRRTVDTTLALPASRSGWYLLRAWSDRAYPPVLDLYPYATTSPIYLNVGGKPVRSAEDAQYFTAWIDRLRGAVQGHRDWNTSEEKARTLEILAQARAEFRQRAAD